MLVKKITKETSQSKMIDCQGVLQTVRETKIYIIGIIVYKGNVTITKLPEDF